MQPMAPKRECGSCSMCCKLLLIPELAKPMGAWCPHVLKGRGCGIYEQRPTSCRQFECLWLSAGDVPDHWRPERSKMVLAGDETGTLISVIVDDGYPDAWRKQPFYNDIKSLARQRRWRVQVLTAHHGWVIFPEEDLFVGERKPDDTIVAFGYNQLPRMRQPKVTVRHGDGGESEYLGGLYPVA
jgi:hypothetical protein